MGELKVYDMKKKEVGKVQLPSEAWGPIRRSLVHQVVTVQMANRRLGTARVKNRHEVSGSTRKIYRQKGTGRARHGDIKAPLFVGGGRVFGPKPRDWTVDLPRQYRQGAVRSVLLQKEKDSKIWILEGLKFDAPKTKKAAALFEQFKIGSGLVVLDRSDQNTEKSIRNLEKFKVCRVDAVQLTDMVRFENLVMTKAAYDRLLERVQ